MSVPKCNAITIFREQMREIFSNCHIEKITVIWFILSYYVI